MVVDRKKSKKKPHQIYISFPNAKIYVSYHILDSRAENFSNPMHILYQKVKKKFKLQCQISWPGSGK